MSKYEADYMQVWRTVASDGAALEQGEAVLGLKRRDLARRELGLVLGRLVRLAKDKVLGLVEGEASSRSRRADLLDHQHPVCNSFCYTYALDMRLGFGGVESSNRGHGG